MTYADDTNWTFIGSMFLAFPVAIVIHELGHAMAARAFGARVYQVAIGSRRDLFHLRVPGTDWVVQLGGGGGIHIAPERLDDWRRRSVRIYAAGAGANAVVAVLSLSLATVIAAPVGIGFAALAYANLLLTASLWPVQVGRRPSDGARIWARWRSSEAEARVEALQLLSAEVGFLARRDRWKEAVERAEFLLGLDETDFMANFVLGMHHLIEEQWESAELRLDRARTHFHPEIGWRALAYQLPNAIGWARLRQGDLVGALAPAEEALALAPNVPEIWDTCGEVWVRACKPEVGMALLERAFAANARSPAARANTARTLALGCELGGDVEGAARWRAAAQELHPDSS